MLQGRDLKIEIQVENETTEIMRLYVLKKDRTQLQKNTGKRYTRQQHAISSQDDGKEEMRDIEHKNLKNAGDTNSRKKRKRRKRKHFSNRNNENYEG